MGSGHDPDEPGAPDGRRENGGIHLAKAAEPAPTGSVDSVLLVDLGTDVRHDLVQAQGLDEARLFRTRLADLDAALLANLRPKTVIGPLMGRNCDAMALIAQLRFLGYEGRIVVLTPTLPNRTMVERELRIAAGSLTLDLIERD